MPKIASLLCFCLLFAQQLTAQEESRFYIYNDQFVNGVPSGYMGSNDGKSIQTVELCNLNPFEGEYCLKFSADGTEQWAGMHLLAAGKWRAQCTERDESAFAQLKGYVKYSFYARADKFTTAEIGFGEGGEDGYAERELQLTPEWKKYTFYVGDVQLESVNSLFYVNFTKATTIYLDEIYFERKIRKSKTKEIQESPKQTITLQPIKTTVGIYNGKQAIFRENKPYFIKGVGGQVYMKRAKEYGANSIRTWSDENAQQVLDSAYANGLTVMFGLWAQHERHGFNYNNPEMVKSQLLKFKKIVQKYKDHPALLLWGIGNEVDLFYTNTNVWFAIQDIAKMIHEIDPNHPTSTVTAGLDTAEIRLIQERCPDIDIYGVNTYGDVDKVAAGFTARNWLKPYIVTEWGPTGHWEIAKTSFDVPIEQTSAEKAKIYKERYQIIKNDSSRCIGSYTFLWGYKQETTPTWYGLFLEDGTETEVIDELQYSWSGKYPTNRAPTLKNILINGKTAYQNIELLAGTTAKATSDIADLENEAIRYEWQIMPESTNKKAGGDFEEAPLPMPDLLLSQKGNTLEFEVPDAPGPYRLFVYGYDAHGNAALANTIFLVK